jgi:hypothetical protein
VLLKGLLQIPELSKRVGGGKEELMEVKRWNNTLELKVIRIGDVIEFLQTADSGECL